MLVLTRKTGERLIIAESIVVQVLEIRGNRVRMGIQAPPGVTIVREELHTCETPSANLVPVGIVGG
jgi:carbon storage regulator